MIVLVSLTRWVSYCVCAGGQIQFSQSLYEVSEAGPSIQVCMELATGAVGAEPVLVQVKSVPNGASNECDGIAECKP